MAQLTKGSAWMSQQETIKDDLRKQLSELQGLLTCLEEQRNLSAREFLYCQAKLHESVQELKRLERHAARAA